MFINEVKQIYEANKKITDKSQLSELMYLIESAAQSGRDKIVLSKSINDSIIKSLKEKGFNVVVWYDRNEQITAISGWANND